MKKCFSVILVLCMLLTMVPFPAAAAELASGQCGDNVTWVLTDDGVLTISGDGEMWDYTADSYPDWSSVTCVEIRGNVTSIGDFAFYKANTIETVRIYSGVTSIGAKSFCSCEGLATVELNEGLQEIGEEAFYFCNKLTTINLPSTLKILRSKAFYHDVLLTDVVLPNGLEVLGSQVFYYCISLKEINIPGSLTSFDAVSFGYCEGLETATFGEGLEFVQAGTFLNCVSLKKVQLPSTMRDIENGAFRRCTSLTDINLPYGLKTIKFGAFAECNLTDIRIPETVSIIGHGVFQQCTALKEVEIPGSVTKIEYELFKGCENLEKVTFNQGTATMDYGVFDDCPKVVSVTIPSTVTSLNRTFEYATGIQTLYFQGDAPEITGDIFNGVTATAYYPAGNATWTADVMQNYGGTITWVADGSSTTPDPDTPANACGDNVTWELDSAGNLTITGEGPMWDYTADTCPDWSAAKTVEITGNVTHIGAYAFCNAGAIETVHVTGAVETVGQYAFFNCESMYYVKLPNTLTAIGDYAFAGCTNLGSMANTGVVIPDSVTSIGTWAFRNCTYMTKLRLGSGVKTIGDEAFAGCKTLTTVTIPAGVTAVGTYAFMDCAGLTSVALGENLPVISKGMFQGCTSLRSVNIPDSVISVGDSAFADCTAMSSLVIGGGVQNIGSLAFSQCTALRNFSFHGDAPAIKADAFNGVTAAVYYFELADSWTEDKQQNYGGNLTWIPSRSVVYVATENIDRINEAYILIKAVDDAEDSGQAMDGVMISSYFGDENLPVRGCRIGRVFAAEKTVTLSKPGYNDYVIPTAVSESLVGYNDTAYPLTAYMHKYEDADEPYISTVFGRFHGENAPYVDLRVTPLKVSSAQTYDVIITAGGFEDQDLTYFIGQYMGAGIANETGVFSAADLANVLTPGAPLYAYVVAADGTKTKYVELKLRYPNTSHDLSDLFGLSEMELLGKDFLKIKIADDVPGLAGAEIDLTAFSIPFGFVIEGDTCKMSLGLDIFERADEGTGWESTWKILKNQVEILKDLDDAKGELQTFSNTTDVVKKMCEKNNVPYPGWVDASMKKMGFNAGVLGYLEAQYINGEWRNLSGFLTLDGGFSFHYVVQGALGVIPAYGTAEAGASFTATIAPESLLRYPIDWEGGVKVEPQIEVEAGLGVPGAISVGPYGKGSVPVLVDFTNERLQFKLTGEWGVHGKFFIFEGKKVMWKGEETLYDAPYGDKIAAVSAATYDAASAPATVTEATTVMSRDYADSTSDWRGGNAQVMGITTNVSVSASAAETTGGVSFQDLQTDIFENSQPQLVSVGEQLLLTWIQDDTTRDTYNRMRLVYALYDPDTNSWTEPVAVWDDGHNDGYPRLVSDGETAWVLWQKIDATMTAANTTDMDALLNHSELCLARFDAQTGEFVEQQMITSDALFEYGHCICLINDIPVVYWASAQGNALSDSGCHVLSTWCGGNTEILAQGLNYLLSIDAQAGEVTYVMDADGDLDSTQDVTAYTLTETGTDVFDNGEMGNAVTYAAYGQLGGEQVLFLSDMSNIHYQQDGQWKTVLSSNRIMAGNLEIVQTPQGMTVMWTENVQGWNELYAVRYQDGSWSEPVRVSDCGELLSQISAAYCGDKIIGVCNTNAVSCDETTGEYVRGATDLTMFRFADFTDIALGNSLLIQEEELEVGQNAQILVSVYNNGTVAVDALTFVVADTLGTAVTQTFDLQLPSGGEEILILNYPVPENYAATTLTATVQASTEDVDPSDNSVSVEIGKYDLSIAKTAVEYCNGYYLLKAVVENNSLVSASNTMLSAYMGSEDAVAFYTTALGTVSRSNYTLVEIAVSEDSLTYDESGLASVYLTVSADGEEAANADNTICVLLSQQIPTACAHPFTEIAEVKEPTCSEQGYTTYICAVCGDSYVDDYTDMVVHSYVDGACKWCGEEEYYVKWASMNTTLYGSIGMNWYVVLSDNLVNDDTFVRFTINGRIQDVPLTDATVSVKDGVTRYRFSCKVYAKEINDMVIAQVMTPGGAVGASHSYSVAKYCYYTIDVTSDAKIVAVCKAMLNYGAAAQNCFGYRVEDLANADLGEADRVVAEFDTAPYAYSIVGAEAGIKASGAKLLLEDNVAIQVSFALTGINPIDCYTVTIDGEAVEYVKANGSKYYFELDGIYASQFDEPHVFSTGGLTVNYSVLSYANQVYTNAAAPAALRHLMNALYAYYVATDVYVH